METVRARILVGALLILVGILFLLQNLGFFELGAVIFGLLFAAGGVAFLYLALSRRDAWWAVIPGLSLIGLGVMVLANGLGLPGAEIWSPTIFFAAIGLGFWVVYYRDRSNWWAIIPGGVLLSLALVILVSGVAEGEVAGAALFIGIGLTFLVLSVVPTPEGRLTWARIPAVVLILFGLFVGAAATELVGYLWPAALILGGLFLLVRALTAGRRR